MGTRFTFQWRSAVIALGALVVALVLAFFFWSDGDSAEGNSDWTRPHPTVETSSPTVEAIPVEIGAPKSVIVGNLDIDAPIIPLGFADDGSQAVPKTLHETGWWKHGSRPGQTGNGVIVGHATSRGKGVFNGLDTLKSGDQIVVKGESGQATFTVTRTAKKPKADFAEVADDIYRTSGGPGLVLMTCGEWNGEVHEDIIFVYANLLAT